MAVYYNVRDVKISIPRARFRKLLCDNKHLRFSDK